MRLGPSMYLAFLAAALLTACEAPMAPDTVVLVTVDTWRADRLGLYGAERPTSPVLEQLAADAVVFDLAIAPAPWTWPTIAAISAAGSPRRLSTEDEESGLCDQAQTLAEVFSEAGWRTGFAGINEFFVHPRRGLRQGFDDFWVSGTSGDQRVIRQARRMLGEAEGRPLFLHLHFFGPHAPFLPSDEAIAALRDSPMAPAADPAPQHRARPGGERPARLHERAVLADVDQRRPGREGGPCAYIGLDAARAAGVLPAVPDLRHVTVLLRFGTKRFIGGSEVTLSLGRRSLRRRDQFALVCKTSQVSRAQSPTRWRSSSSRSSRRTRIRCTILVTALRPTPRPRASAALLPPAAISSAR